VAQKNAEKALASNAAARKQPFYANNENDTTSPPITTKTPAINHQYTPAVSDGSSSDSSDGDSDSSDGDGSGGSGGSISTRLSSEAQEESTCGNGINSGGHNLLSELDAENEESSPLPSSASGAGRSNKENVTPSPSTLTVGSLDTVDKILGGMSTDAAAAVAATMSAGSNRKRNTKTKVQTVNVHPYGGVGGGKKYMVSKKALRLEGQWAMFGEAQTDSDESSDSSSESGSSASSSISSTSNQGDDAAINASTKVVQGTPASRVNQDPGELLSTTGVSFLEDESYVDGEVDGLNLDSHTALLSPVVEGDTTEEAGMTTPAAAANINHEYAKQIYTFTPGSSATHDGGTTDVSSDDAGASPASIGMFDELNSEWMDASADSDNSAADSVEKSNGNGNGDISTGTTLLKDASMWVLPPEQDSSNDTISNAPSDETDGSIPQTSPDAAVEGKGANERQVLGDLSIGEYDESVNDDIKNDEDDCVAMLSPNECLRTNAIDQALEETTLYMNKIKELESALHKAERSAGIEAQKRRKLESALHKAERSAKIEAQERRICEKRIDELVMQQDQDQPIAAQTPPEETTLYMNKIMELESALHKAERSAKIEAQERHICEKRIDELVMQQDQDQPIVAQTPAGIATLDALNFSAFISPYSLDVEAEEHENKQDHSIESSESSELLDARAATASLMERNQTLVKEIRFADQTCVELSERNAALERDVQRLEKELESSKTAQEDFRERLQKSATHVAKLEERARSNTQNLSHQQSLFDAKMAATETELATARVQVSSLQSKVNAIGEEKLALVADVAAAKSKVKAMELSRVSQVVLSSPPPSEIDSRKEEYEQTKKERDALTNKCGELEAQIGLLSRSIEEREKVKTPQKIIVASDIENNAASSRTPTSTVLAKTLQSQLERGNSVEDRARDAEKTIVALQMQLEVSRAETTTVKEEVRVLRDAQEKQKQIESDSDASSKYEEQQEEIEYETDASAEYDDDDDSACTSASAARIEKVQEMGTSENSKEVVNLRSQLHEALYDKKALLIEVSTCKASIQALEDQLASRANGADAEAKIRIQQKEIENLTRDVSNLQAKLDMESEALSTETPSLASELTSSPAGVSKATPSALGDTDAALDATFSTGRLERCEEGWATPAAKEVDNIDENAKETTMMDENDKLQSQLLDECQMQLKLSLAELEAARAEAADMLNKLEEDKDILIEDNELLAVEIEEMKAELQMERAKAKEAAQTAEMELHRISSELALAKAPNTEIDSFQSSIDMASKRVAALEDDLLNAKAQIEVKDIESAALMRQCEEQGDAIAQYRSLRLEDAKTVEDLRDALQESSAQSDTLKQSLVDCNEKLASEIEQKMEMEEETSRLRSELASIKDQSQTVAADKDATIRELTTSNQRSRTAIESELDAAVQERNQLAREAEKAMSSLQRDISAAASSMRSLATSLDISDSCVQVSPGNGQQHQSHFTFSLRPHAQDRGDDSSLASAQAALAQMKATIEAVRQKVEERDALAFDMEVKNKRLASDVSKLSKDAKESKTKQGEMEVLLNQATQKLQSHMSKLSLANSDLQRSRDSVTALESACERLKVERNSAISKLSEKETSLVDTLVRQREDSSSVLKDLKEKLAVVEEERKRYATANEALTKKCSRLREYVKSLTEKCEEWSNSYRIQSTEVIATKKENMDLTQRVSQMHSLVDDCPELDPSCTSCVQLRSVIEAQTQVRAALLHSGS